MSDEEKELVEQAKNGCQKAFEQIYKRYSSSARIVIRQFYSDKNIVDDLVNTTFIKVFKKLNKFVTNDSFKSWVNTIANNTAIDYQRKEKKTRGIVYSADDDTNFFQLESTSCNSEEELVLKETYSNLLIAISTLPKRQREVASMFYIDGISYKVISQKLAMPEGTIKSLLFRARAVLKKYFH